MAPLAMPGASSGFLRQAATTAAGIAGGALLFEGISSLFVAALRQWSCPACRRSPASARP